ncbi:MAG: Spx/MgsR family RNA polymerase-binding regulatory protein [Helicobacteraceae bacterium]|jgi:arsenate reductase|nr:Spx/MgsR family RNA polymerase-binding regulatory protein [Helicobacteraceae bacterium]
MVKLYGIKNCDSVKKAIKFLNANAIDFELIDFKATPVDCATVSPWLKHVEMKRLFNTRGTTYRTLKLKELDLTEEQQLQWLCKENLLIKRPVLDLNGEITVAFEQKVYENLFL